MTTLLPLLTGCHIKGRHISRSVTLEATLPGYAKLHPSDYRFVAQPNRSFKGSHRFVVCPRMHHSPVAPSEGKNGSVVCSRGVNRNAERCSTVSSCTPEVTKPSPYSTFASMRPPRRHELLWSIEGRELQSSALRILKDTEFHSAESHYSTTRSLPPRSSLALSPLPSMPSLFRELLSSIK